MVAYSFTGDHTMLFKKSILLLSLHCLIGACSNDLSGDKSKPQVNSQNMPPVLSHNNPQSVDSFTSVYLNVNAIDTDGTINSYSWIQNSGLPVQLSNSNSANVSFEAPEITGELSFTVSVIDDKGASSSETINIDIIGPLIGSWSREGYHQYITVNLEQVSLLEYTPNKNDLTLGWCYFSDDVATAELQKIAPISFSDDYQAMSLDPLYFGDDDGRRYYKKLNQLPEICKNGGMLTADDLNFSDDATDDFQLFWHAFQTHYPFFELRNKDWQKEYEQHVGLVNSDTSVEELAEIFSSMLNNISDGHIGISLGDDHIDINNDWVEQGVFKRLKTQFEQQKYDNNGIADFWNYYWHRVEIQNDIVTEKYVDIEQSIELAEESSIAWGKFTTIGQKNIGYLRVGSFATDDQRNYQFFINAIDSAMASLHASDALIIDLRLNSGGNEVIGFHLANYFADKKRHAFSKQVQDINGLSEAAPFFIEPHNNKSLYDKPVRILIDAGSASAAETFSIVMRTLNQVQIFGERSAGDTASQLSKILPFSGMEIRIPNTIYTTFDNKVFENIGVQVDNLILDFTAEDLLLEKDSVLDAALNSLK